MIAQCGDNIVVYELGSILRIDGNFIGNVNEKFCVDKKNQLDVTFCILYFSSNSCSTYFGQTCAHHQELTAA